MCVEIEHLDKTEAQWLCSIEHEHSREVIITCNVMENEEEGEI